ncbi:MAG: hypothetical protein ACTHK7_15550 [Aureliella sp.]
MNQLNLKGRYTVEHIRNGKVIHSEEFPNLITNEGKNKLLDVMFHGDTQIGTWYLGLIGLTGYSALAATDVYAQINGTNGWDEFVSYTDPANSDSAVTRPAWTEGAAASQSITNGTVVSFDITAAGTVKGIFLAGGANAQTKSNATAGNILWSAALFSGGDRVVADGDVLKVTYTVSA